ncbi:hypothetical protein IFR04_005501 [Cadophora malorum]|uniref:Uncharacterized protein n=1 Tax=Cadophora malorum TaxID=108018 RepID=A0A8H7WB54_9HELO|nr:hypothetical protein IFR04_005501 [Cadophora malorum]
MLPLSPDAAGFVALLIYHLVLVPFWNKILVPFWSKILVPLYVLKYPKGLDVSIDSAGDVAASFPCTISSLVTSWLGLWPGCKLPNIYSTLNFLIELFPSYLRNRRTKRKMIWITTKAFGKLLFLFVTVKFIVVVLWIERSNIIALSLGLGGAFCGWHAWSRSYHLALLQTAWAKWPELTTAEALERLHQELDSTQILHSYF